MSITRKCTVDNCKDRLLAKGYCTKHYQRVSKYGSTNLPEKELKSCSIKYCNNKYFGIGYCNMHWQRFKKYGDAEYTSIIYANQTKHTLYKTWVGMKTRCYNKNNKDYTQYGKRGIKVCDRWLGKYGFTNFIKDMGDRPTKSHSIDRIDNDKDYSPENCRWGTKQEQSRNRSLLSNNKSGVTGVRQEASGKWLSTIYAEGENKRLGLYISKSEAIKARKAAENKYWNKGE